MIATTFRTTDKYGTGITQLKLEMFLEEGEMFGEHIIIQSYQR